MIVPIGEDYDTQILKKVIKKGKEYISETLINVRFVPLIEGKENQ
jgi:protein-L-isoaspartate O-methyltransferase